MKIVTNQSGEQMAARDASDELDRAIAAFTANCFRVVAGAGAHYELISQLRDVLNAYEKFLPFLRSGVYQGRPPMVDVLNDWKRKRPDHPPDQSKADEHRRDLEDAVARAEDSIMQHSLRVIAARLLSQRTQESNADHRLWEALMEWRRAYDARADYR